MAECLPAHLTLKFTLPDRVAQKGALAGERSAAVDALAVLGGVRLSVRTELLFRGEELAAPDALETPPLVVREGVLLEGALLRE